MLIIECDADRQIFCLGGARVAILNDEVSAPLLWMSTTHRVFLHGVRSALTSLFVFLFLREPYVLGGLTNRLGGLPL